MAAKFNPAPDADAETNANAIDNGLSTPRPVDLNGDGTVDVVYAGDLKGNMWKFDVSNKVSTGNWDVAFSGKPLYIAKDEGGTRQPITSAPNVRTNKSVGGMMVAFGTGRNVATCAYTPQTWHALAKRSLHAACRAKMGCNARQTGR